MENTIPALLIAAILVFGSVTVAAVTNSSLNKANDSWREMEALAEERLGTELTVVSTQVSPDGADITVVIRNTGRTPIENPSLMDVVVTYTGADSQRYSRWMAYADGALGDNTWKVTGITGDYHNPGILDNGEQMTLQVHLNPPASNGPDRWLAIATETGITYTVYF